MAREQRRKMAKARSLLQNLQNSLAIAENGDFPQPPHKNEADRLAWPPLSLRIKIYRAYQELLHAEREYTGALEQAADLRLWLSNEQKSIPHDYTTTDIFSTLHKSFAASEHGPMRTSFMDTSSYVPLGRAGTAIFDGDWSCLDYLALEGVFGDFDLRDPEGWRRGSSPFPPPPATKVAATPQPPAAAETVAPLVGNNPGRSRPAESGVKDERSVRAVRQRPLPAPNADAGSDSDASSCMWTFSSRKPATRGGHWPPAPSLDLSPHHNFSPFNHCDFPSTMLS